MEHLFFDLLGGFCGAALYTALYFKYQRHTLAQWLKRQQEHIEDRKAGVARYQKSKAK